MEKRSYLRAFIMLIRTYIYLHSAPLSIEQSSFASVKHSLQHLQILQRTSTKHASHPHPRRYWLCWVSLSLLSPPLRPQSLRPGPHPSQSQPARPSRNHPRPRLRPELGRLHPTHQNRAHRRRSRLRRREPRECQDSLRCQRSGQGAIERRRRKARLCVHERHMGARIE